MIAAIFAAAVLLTVVGHIFKVGRWKLFVSVYEKPSEANLLNSMTFGHTVNAVLPVRLGDIVRVVWSGRRLKNGFSLAFATVAADLYVDLITVGAMSFALSLIGKGGERLLAMAHLYTIAFAVIIPLTLLAVLCRKAMKRIVAWIAGLFNEKIEFTLLYVSYLCIASIKDIIRKINKLKFLAYTACIWIAYCLSYLVFADAVQRIGYEYSMSDVFTRLFSGSSLYHIEKGLVPFWAAYLLLPLFICLVISLIVRKKENAGAVNRTPLPQMNRADRLSFLRTYYGEENRSHIEAYLTINSDVAVVEDNSAGSNASTVLVMKPDGNMFFRKYAFDADGDKLQEQIDWIEAHQKDIPLPLVADKRRGSNYVTYDMPSYSSTCGLFRYIHTMPAAESWAVLERGLEEIRTGLHTKNNRPADIETIQKYIQGKVVKNLKIITEDDKFIRALEQYDTITVNGRRLRTLKFYRDMLEPEHMTGIFKNDMYSDVHGDLTIENIVCLSDPGELDKKAYEGKVMPETYYFIDPNTGNVHDSPFLDYGKLLQSLHGNYEFLMMVTSVAIDKSSVNYLMTKSEAYAKVYEKFRDYLKKQYSPEQVLSIYYHEVIHWLRLMPYKIRKNERLAVVFYTGLLTVLNDVWEMEHGEE